MAKWHIYRVREGRGYVSERLKDHVWLVSSAVRLGGMLAWSQMVTGRYCPERDK